MSAPLRSADPDRRSLTARILLLSGALAASAWRVRAADSPAILRREVDGGGRPAPYAPPPDLEAATDLFSRMTVPVWLNGKGPFPFVLDTGANRSVICGALATELGLEMGPSAMLHGAAGMDMAPTVRIDHVRSGRMERAGVTLSVLPQAPLGGHGFIGLDLLDKQRLTLDFRRRRIVVESSRGADRSPRDVVLKAHFRGGQLTLVNGAVGGIGVTAFLDSGAPTTIGNMALQRMASARMPDLPWAATDLISATGRTLPGQWAMLRNFRLGPVRVAALPVVFADLHTFRIWNLVDAPAMLLGVDLMSQFEYVALDFPRGEVRLRPPGTA